MKADTSLKRELTDADRGAIAAVVEVLGPMERPSLHRNPEHCSECAQAETHLMSLDPSDVDWQEIDRMEWFASITPEGFRYFLPGLCRIALESEFPDWFVREIDHHFAALPEPMHRAAVAEFIDYLAIIQPPTFSSEWQDLQRVRDNLRQPPGTPWKGGRWKRRRAFTLVEVMLAVLIVSLLMVSVFRFVQTVLKSVAVSTEATLTKQEMTGFLNYMETQLEDLPKPQANVQPARPAELLGVTVAGKTGTSQRTGITDDMAASATLSGSPHRYNDSPADEIEWVTPVGHGTLTTAGSDQYRVTLAIQNVRGKSSEYEIGLRRRKLDADERDYDWLPLLRPAAALEIRYYEPSGRTWIDAWKDPSRRPSLVKIRVWRAKDQPPEEAIIALPSARTGSVILTQ